MPKKNIIRVLSLISLFVFCSSQFFAYNFTSSGKDEIVAAHLSKASALSTAKITSLVATKYAENEDAHRSLVNDLNQCASLNIERTHPKAYSFRCSFRNTINTKTYISDLEREVTLIPHAHSGSPRINTKNEILHGDLNLRLMFDASHTNLSNKFKTSYLYITQSMADDFLQKKGITEPSENDYLNLVFNKDIQLSFVKNDSTISLSYNIANIIIDNERDDPLLRKLYGNYLTINSYFGTALPDFSGYSVDFDFGVSRFDNKRYLPVIRQCFPLSLYNYSFKIGETNSSGIDTYTNDLLLKITSLVSDTNSINSAIPIIVSAISLILFVFFLYIAFSQFKNRLACTISTISIVVFSYLFVFVLSNIVLDLSGLISTTPIIFYLVELIISSISIAKIIKTNEVKSLDKTDNVLIIIAANYSLSITEAKWLKKISTNRHCDLAIVDGFMDDYAIFDCFDKKIIYKKRSYFSPFHIEDICKIIENNSYSMVIQFYSSDVNLIDLRMGKILGVNILIGASRYESEANNKSSKLLHRLFAYASKKVVNYFIIFNYNIIHKKNDKCINAEMIDNLELIEKMRIKNNENYYEVNI